MGYIHWYRQIYIPRLVAFPGVVWLYIAHLFSLPLLVTSLFSPWKREDSRHLGLENISWFEKVTLNLFSRLIGFTIRLPTLIFGTFLLIYATINAALIVLFLIIIPISGAPIYFLKQQNTLKIYPKNLTLTLSYFYSSRWWYFLAKRIGIEKQDLTDALASSAVTENDLQAFTKTYKKSDFGELEFFQFMYTFSPVAEVLAQKYQIYQKDLDTLKNWYVHQMGESQKISIFNEDYILSTPSIGGRWSYGFTPSIDSFCKDLTKNDWRYFDFVNRVEELDRLTSLLNRPEQPYVIVHGRPGVGRKSLIYGLTKKITWNGIPAFNHIRIIWLEPDRFLDVKSQHNLSVQFKNILDEAARAGNVILVINNIHELLRQSQDPDFVASEVLSSSLASSSFPVIGITTTRNYKQYVLSDQQIQQYFSNLEIKELSEKDALLICFLKALAYEKTKKITYLYEAIKACVELSTTYISHDVLPEKAIDLIEKASVGDDQSDNSNIKKEHIEDLITQETGIDISAPDQADTELLLNLEQKIGQYVIGQELAVEQVAKAIRRNRTHVSDRHRPIGSFIFLGPTGVGKTTTAQAVATLYFNNSEMIRFDMAEYQSVRAVERLIGDAQTSGELAEKIRQRPHTVLLLDEFEKAPREIHNLFLTILDEGYFVTGNDLTIDCSHLIIIATSNAASEEMRQYYLEQGSSTAFQDHLISTLIDKGYFSPELLNRFDEVVYYQPLASDNLTLVVKKELSILANRLKEEQQIDLNWSDHLVEAILTQGYDPVFGVRSIQRYIKNTVEDQISQILINDPATKQINL